MDQPPQPFLVLRDDDPRLADLMVEGARVVATSWGAVLRVDDPPQPALLERLDVFVARARARGAVVGELAGSAAAELLALQEANRLDYSHDPSMALPPGDLTATRAQWDGGGRVFGARLAGLLVAATVMQVDDRGAETLFTSVLRVHRRHGLGSAVKAAGVRTLVNEGVRTLRTGGAGDNVASLAANRALGYEVDERWLTLVR
ncbi:MAG: acetyltransferase [Actinobacteria bacterium]|nr:acetyltransferase [Actinomycetota bacterium]